MRYYFTPIRMSIIKNATNVFKDEKRGLLYTVGGNVNWCCHWRTVRSFLRKVKATLPYVSAALLLDIYQEKMKIQRDSCIPMLFRTALFIIAKVWKQPECPWTNKWVRKICIYTGMLLSHEKNEVVFFFFLTFWPKQFWMRSMQIPLLVLRFHWFLKSECWGPIGDTWTPFSWIVWHLPPCLQISGASS